MEIFGSVGEGVESLSAKSGRLNCSSDRGKIFSSVPEPPLGCSSEFGVAWAQRPRVRTIKIIESNFIGNPLKKVN